MAVKRRYRKMHARGPSVLLYRPDHAALADWQMIDRSCLTPQGTRTNIPLCHVELRSPPRRQPRSTVIGLLPILPFISPDTRLRVLCPSAILISARRYRSACTSDHSGPLISSSHRHYRNFLRPLNDLQPPAPSAQKSVCYNSVERAAPPRAALFRCMRVSTPATKGFLNAHRKADRRLP